MVEIGKNGHDWQMAKFGENSQKLSKLTKSAEIGQKI